MAIPHAPVPPPPFGMSTWAASGAALWLYRSHRLLQKLSGNRASLHVYLFCAQPLGAIAPTSVRDNAATRVIPVGPGNPLLKEFPRPQAVLAKRLASGATCHAVILIRH